jgi:predicted Zn-ribbon and HTH transcriptional regulator
MTVFKRKVVIHKTKKGNIILKSKVKKMNEKIIIRCNVCFLESEVNAENIPEKCPKCKSK